MPSCTQGACPCDCSACSMSYQEKLELENEQLKHENSDLRSRLRRFETDIQRELQKKEAEMRAEIEEEVKDNLRRKLNL